MKYVEIDLIYMLINDVINKISNMLLNGLVIENNSMVVINVIIKNIDILLNNISIILLNDGLI